ncbi:uncharacterized protein [Montipora foliosa]|uniref:uncharacterized protein n=1 Tax=Montipora foliosa TaxID=591990 RepID=UPI0035F14681
MFIHGGKLGSHYGAWDYIVANAPKELVGDFITSYKRGKYIQEVFEKAMKEHQAAPETLNQAIACKYQNFLSRRKFNLVCKTQSSYFNAESEVWVPRNVKCVGLDLRVPRLASHDAVEKFVKGLNIGMVSQIPNAPGVSRTVTGLVFMILDLHLRVPHLTKKLVWFNDLENHFVFQFSDDGAPETSQMTMSIGSLTMWNLGKRVRSADFQYLLHCVSLGEKHEVLEDLWKQHTNEMALLEGNMITVCGKQCTVEFQPSADMCWQSWANNEINQAATYPSPYANVHKGSFCTMGGSIGYSPSNTWKPYSNADRSEHTKMIAKFMSTLDSSLPEKNKHERKLAYMAENGIRQLGSPRIGQFADRQRPEPLHCEINAWQQILSIIYLEFVKKDMFDVFVRVLSNPTTKPASANGTSGTARERLPSTTGGEAESVYNGSSAKPVTANSTGGTNNEHPLLGCGLSYLVPLIKEHYADEKKRHNKIPTRLIGAQAIALARYAYRLIDSLHSSDESPVQRVTRLALGRIVLHLREACSIFNKVSTTQADLQDLDENCKLYFNLMCLFFPTHVNITSWTVAYAIPYHAFKLYEKYKVGYGIISQQGKEAKHCGVKNDLALSNRSMSQDTSGKWWQVTRANYVRSFYLPEHQPMPNTYKSHFQSRVPPHCQSTQVCNCGRAKAEESEYCETCLECDEIVKSAESEKLSEGLTKLLKPLLCTYCGERFADESILETHVSTHSRVTVCSNRNPRT